MSGHKRRFLFRNMGNYPEVISATSLIFVFVADNVPVNAKDEVGQDNDAEDNKLPSDDNNDKKADDDVDVSIKETMLGKLS